MIDQWNQLQGRVCGIAVNHTVFLPSPSKQCNIFHYLDKRSLWITGKQHSTSGHANCLLHQAQSGFVMTLVTDGSVFKRSVPQAPPPLHPHGWHGSPSVCVRSGSSPHCGARPAATDERLRDPVPKTPPTSPKRHIKSKATHYMCCHSVGEERDQHTLWFRDRTIKLLVWPLSAEYLSCQFSGRGRWGLWAGWVTVWDHFLLSESDIDENRRLPAAHA